LLPEVPEGVSEVAETHAGLVYRKDARGQSEVASAGDMNPELETLAARRTRDELVIGHVRLAASLARRFADRGESVEDLRQVAMVALIKAAKRFDPSRDTRFATYATSSILGELKRHFRDKTWMLRVARPVQELYLEVKRARDELTNTLGATPTLAQIAEYLGTTEDAVREATDAGASFWPASLDGRGTDETVTDVPVLDADLDRSAERIDLRRLMPGLDERERLVLRRIYFDELTQRDVAIELGVSQMQVSRMLAKAMAKLRT
jgi:RNA polymerase sigma-B factor